MGDDKHINWETINELGKHLEQQYRFFNRLAHTKNVKVFQTTWVGALSMVLREMGYTVDQSPEAVASMEAQQRELKGKLQ